MTYKVRLVEDEDGGFAAICPELPGCVSQGETEAEAMSNVTEAIRFYLEVRDGLLAQQGGTLREVELKNVAQFARINHQEVVRALLKKGFWVARQSGHIVMTDGSRVVVVPRHNPINPITMGTIVADAGLTIDEFRALLK